MKLKGFVTAAAIAGGITAIAIGMAGPAAADPAAVSTIAGAGSDTIQDVMNQLATDDGGNLVGSWDAFKPGTTPPVVHDDITPKSTTACTNVTRPNGSGEGVGALRRSLSGSTKVGSTASVATGLAPHAIPLGAACFDFARSSSGPGANASTSGLLQYVPFALDGVTVAVGPASGTDATNIKGSFTEAQLKTLYSVGTPQVGSDGVTYDPNSADGTTGTAIHLLLPQAGSGTRTFFAGVMGINATTPPAWVKDTFVPTAGGAAQSVEEHDGTAVQLDHNALAPFSSAQWISQARGHNDRRHGAVLETINSTNPCLPTTSACSDTSTLNESFPSDFLREVYNVIPVSATTSGGSDANLFNVFVSTSSLKRICSHSTDITNYGFGLLTSAPKGHTCGQVSSDLKAFAPGVF